MTDAQKRQYVSDLYSGPKWKRKVEHMPDDQVTAIYLNHINDGQTPSAYSELQQEPEIEMEPHLVDLADIPRPAGPHWNEDEFPTY